MPELIDAEGIRVVLGRDAQILPDRMPIGAVRIGIDEQPIERVERADEADNLGGGMT
jgi:hypothetical protein